MLNRFRRIKSEKGQGLTEYVLILAFIAGLAILMYSSDGNLKGTLVDTFTETNRILAGLFGEKTDWGHMNTSEFNADNQSERLAADQGALENLASFFVGKTEAQIQALLTDGIFHTSGQEVLLGWFVNTDTGNHFFTKNLKSDGGAYTFGNGTVRSTNDQVFNWILGDYGENGNYNYSYDSTNNYLVSDYPLGQYSNSGMKWDDPNNWEPGTGGNGIKISLTFDKTGGDKNKSNWKVTSATIKLDSLSQNKPNGSGGLSATVNAS
jgi:Flp pilus assembly pilin Flp